MHTTFRHALLALGFLAAGVISTRAAEDAPGKTFLKRYCTSCHGAEKQEGELRLDQLSDLPRDELPERWHQIHEKLAAGEMPPEDAKQPDAKSRGEILKWITKTYGEAPTRVHWAFQPVVRPPVPGETAPDKPRANAIDAFVLAKLKQQKLTASPPAQRPTLIRRVTLDLIGLPPTPEEVQAFVQDSDEIDVAYARVVDRLLRSPRYGERWAQHWLDVIRWAETVGFETNLERPNAWHYRDWVIDALNDDKPYDRFIFEQIAGDTEAADAALGFLVAGPANLPGQIGRDEEAMRQARQDELDEVIRTVSQSLFGLTIGCARCHDHKFDPIQQRDYYALQAIFAGLSYGDRRLRGKQNDAWTAQVPKARDKLASLKRELAAVRQQYQLRPPLESIHTETFTPVRTDAVRMEIPATGGGPASLYEFELWSTASDEVPARNVALASTGATPSASSFALANQTRHFDNLVDGSVDKRQAFPWVAEQAGPAWLQIDLPAAVSVDRVVWQSGASTPASYEIRAREAKSGEWTTVAHTKDRLPRISDTRAAKDVRIERMSSEQVDSLCQLLAKIRGTQSELTRLSNGPQTYAARFTATPDKTWLLKRGDPLQRDGEVAPAVPAVLQKPVLQKPKSEGSLSEASLRSTPGTPESAAGAEAKPLREVDRRLALAHHLGRPDHPLTARVMVNRIWQHHFGVGLVETPSDFGKMGAVPTHPRLLDWLAAEFVARGWSLKQLHRLIVTSRTYRQSSLPREDALAIDAESRLLWRYPPRRLDAEAIRDSILSVSGKLNLQMHGPGFDFFDRRGGLSDYTPKETFDASGWRRMVYAHKIRMEAVDIFGAFDCPDAGQMTPRRNLSITPIQSLGLFNSPFTNRQAKFFAERIRGEVTDDVQRQVERVFEVALARPPSADERERMETLATAHGLEQVCRVVLNSSEFVFLH